MERSLKKTLLLGNKKHYQKESLLNAKVLFMSSKQFFFICKDPGRTHNLFADVENQSKIFKDINHKETICI